MAKVAPKNEEFEFSGNNIISQTDLQGIIVYANRKFCEVSGYTRGELNGSPHNIIRHPDMPKSVFTKMWQAISTGQAWNGLVKNIRKDGLYYWVDAEILPIVDEDHNVVGYMSVRKPASDKDVKENSELYEKMLESEK